ncbi:Uncharacterised protein [Mycobacteroides abscessus subsp. abscessus]|nr:Uncharacterised protein [Mycobacteroides abscessus subsp. abscessus]
MAPTGRFFLSTKAGVRVAAKTAAEAPRPWPTSASLLGCTLILPSPRRTRVTISSVVAKSAARFRCDGTNPFSVLGAAATIPQDARCSRVARYLSVPVSQSCPNATAGRLKPASGV